MRRHHLSGAQFPGDPADAPARIYGVAAPARPAIYRRRAGPRRSGNSQGHRAGRAAGTRRKPGQPAGGAAMSGDRGVAALSVSDIRKAFGGVEVLKGISLDAHEGDVISILGASGSGKSTLLRCINLLEIPDAGTVTVAGETIRMKPRRKGGQEPADHKQVDRIRTELGMVFQSFNLWSHMTVLQNVIEGPVHVLHRPKAECIGEAEALLEKVGIADKR